MKYHGIVMILSLLFAVNIAYGQVITTKAKDKLPDESKSKRNTMPKPPNGYNKPMVAPKGYKLVEYLSDEFNGGKLDETKWMPRSNDGWRGRGARFMEENVIVANGCLQLKSSVIGSDADLKSLYKDLEDIYVKDESLHIGNNIDVETWSPAIYGKKWIEDWSSGAKYKDVMRKGLNTIGAAIVCSKRPGTKGYYEARMKLSKIAMSSSWWLQGFHTIEFDITESYGSYSVDKDNAKIVDAPYKIHTSVWVNSREFKGKGGIKPKNAKWKTRLCDDFFVLGYEWEDDKLSVYLNDEFQYRFSFKDIRTGKGDLPIPIETYASPQYIKFDTEILLGPLMGWPTKRELRDPDRNTFYVDWIRVWKPIEQQ